MSKIISVISEKTSIIRAFNAICVEHCAKDGVKRAISLRTAARHPIDALRWLQDGVLPEWVVNDIGTEPDR